MAIRSLKSGSFSRSTQVGNSIILPGDYESIATVNVTGTPGTVDFTSIPQTFTHLQLRISVNQSAAVRSVYMRFNSVGGTSYSSHYVYGGGVSSVIGSWTSDGYIRLAAGDGVSNDSNIQSATIVDILDYSNTNKYKTIKCLTGWDKNGGGTVELGSGLYMQTTAVSSINFITGSSNFIAGSKFALYGIRG